MEDKILDLTGLDDASFKVMKKAVTDMLENKTPYILDTNKNIKRKLDKVSNITAIGLGVGLTLAGICYELVQSYKFKKSK